MIEIEIGDQVVHKRTGEYGFARNVRKNRTLMVEVKWDVSGLTQWLPSEELRLPDKGEAVAPVKPTQWGRTTPAYLKDLRTKLRHERPKDFIYPKEKRLAIEKLADDLVSLSTKRKNRSRHRAKGKIQYFEKRYLSERIARDDRHDK